MCRRYCRTVILVSNTGPHIIVQECTRKIIMMYILASRYLVTNPDRYSTVWYQVPAWYPLSRVWYSHGSSTTSTVQYYYQAGTRYPPASRLIFTLDRRHLLWFSAAARTITYCILRPVRGVPTSYWALSLGPINRSEWRTQFDWFNSFFVGLFSSVLHHDNGTGT